MLQDINLDGCGLDLAAEEDNEGDNNEEGFVDKVAAMLEIDHEDLVESIAPVKVVLVKVSNIGMV